MPASGAKTMPAGPLLRLSAPTLPPWARASSPGRPLGRRRCPTLASQKCPPAQVGGVRGCLGSCTRGLVHCPLCFFLPCLLDLGLWGGTAMEAASKPVMRILCAWGGGATVVQAEPFTMEISPNLYFSMGITYGNSTLDAYAALPIAEGSPPNRRLTPRLSPSSTL